MIRFASISLSGANGRQMREHAMEVGRLDPSEGVIQLYYCFNTGKL